MFCLCRGISCGEKGQTQRTQDNEHKFPMHCIFFVFVFLLIFGFLRPTFLLSFDLLFLMSPSYACYAFFAVPHLLLFFRDFSTPLRPFRSTPCIITIDMYYFCIHQHLFPFHHIVPYLFPLRTSMPNYHDRIQFVYQRAITERTPLYAVRCSIRTDLEIYVLRNLSLILANWK